MATFNHLPPELLRLIFSHLFGSRAILELENHLVGQKDLCACALVRSSWRFEAQQLLVKEIWIDGCANHDKISTGLMRPPFDTLKVQSLAICEGSLEHFIGDVERISGDWTTRWEAVSYLTLNEGNLTDRALARFRNLRALSLCCFSRWTVDDPTEVSLPELRRIVFGAELDYEGYDEKFFELFVPSKMPRLAHLSIVAHQVYDDPDILPLVFLKNLLSQIETIAIRSSLDIQYFSTFLQTSASFPKLRHLAVDLESGYTLRNLAIDAAGLNLDSLHVPECFLHQISQEELEQILVKQDRPVKGLHVQRLIVYGHKIFRCYASESLLESHGAKVRWGIGARPPFETFDGTE